jgi:hypothetical protein
MLYSFVRSLRLLFTLAILACVLMGCRKEEGKVYCSEWEENTVFRPLPYLPVFPGSEWTYVDVNGDSVTKRVSSALIPHSWDNGDCSTHTAFVPFWDGKPMYGYSYPIPSSPVRPPTVLFPLLMDAPIGTQEWYEAPTHLLTRMVSNRDTTITIQGTTYDEVLVIAEGGPIFVKWSYYAKDIGLIKEEQRIGSDTLTTLDLVSFTIAP